MLRVRNIRIEVIKYIVRVHIILPYTEVVSIESCASLFDQGHSIGKTIFEIQSKTEQSVNDELSRKEIRKLSVKAA